MRYSLLNFLSRPKSNDELVCISVKETEAPMVHWRHQEFGRVSQAGALVGPLPDRIAGAHPMAGVLTSNSTHAAAPERDHEVEVETGLLVCPATGRWYPIRGFIPEILPDHLRDLQADFEFLRSLRDCLPPDLYGALDSEALFAERSIPDEGLKYKRSEIGITKKIEDPVEFFGPGYFSPFMTSDRFQTAYFLRVFAFCISMIQSTGGRVVLDTGSGYSWTTEWLMRSGYESIGLDITRAYLDVGQARMGMNRPYLVLGDTENLPIRTNSIDVVLGFESFHHIPDRRAATAQFDRVLGESGHIILAEPGGAHEAHHGSKAVMDKYGILERGMELEDVLGYVAGTGFSNVEQIIPLRTAHWETQRPLTEEFVATHNWSAANLYVINRNPVLQRVAQSGFRAALRRRIAASPMTRTLRDALNLLYAPERGAS